MIPPFAFVCLCSRSSGYVTYGVKGSEISVENLAFDGLTCHAMDSEFSRLEAQLDALAALIAAADSDAEIVDHVVVDRATWTLAARVHAAVGKVTFALPGAHMVSGWVVAVGEDHVELGSSLHDQAVHAIVRPSKTLGVSGLGNAQRVLPSLPRTLASALRNLVLDTSSGTFVLTDGQAIHGQLAHVQSDHIDVVTQLGTVVLPLKALCAVIVTG